MLTRYGGKARVGVGCIFLVGKLYRGEILTHSGVYLRVRMSILEKS